MEPVSWLSLRTRFLQQQQKNQYTHIRVDQQSSTIPAHRSHSLQAHKVVNGFRNGARQLVAAEAQVPATTHSHRSTVELPVPVHKSNTSQPLTEGSKGCRWSQGWRPSAGCGRDVGSYNTLILYRSTVVFAAVQHIALPATHFRFPRLPMDSGMVPDSWLL
jgi:hypothetical protein